MKGGSQAADSGGPPHIKVSRQALPGRAELLGWATSVRGEGAAWPPHSWLGTQKPCSYGAFRSFYGPVPVAADKPYHCSYYGLAARVAREGQQLGVGGG